MTDETEAVTEAAKALQKAGYATDPNYANKLIELIRLYDLSRFDNKPS